MGPGARKPKRGDIWHLDFSPAAGTEMLYRRYGLVLSADEFNKAIPRIYIAPVSTVSSIARSSGFQVNLSGAGTQTTGVIDLTQARAVDLRARNGSFVESIPEDILQDVLARFRAIFD